MLTPGFWRGTNRVWNRLTLSSSVSMELPDLSEDLPAGEDLEVDPDFVAMERAAEETPETQYGQTINAAVPADWKEVQSLAASLLARTRDLRVLVQLAIARLNLTGVAAFAEVLAQIRHQIETRWEQVHPRLDPEDDNDPTLRANTLVRLQDPRNVLRPLREMPLARSPHAGVVSWRDIAISMGQIDPDEGAERPTEALIRGIFSTTDRERLQLLRDGVDLAVTETLAIGKAFDGFAGNVLDLSNLSKLLAAIQKDLRTFEPAADQPPPEAEEEAEAGVEASAGAAVSGTPTVRRGGVTARSLTSVTQREDALYLMELASTYFRANEPSSPVPLLIERARRLAAMDFLDILRDLAPNGIEQAQIVAGTPIE